MHHKNHSKAYYYARRAAEPTTALGRAAQFIYLNRACWNGLYRVNQRGQFNVPIGTKDWIISSADDFAGISAALQGAELAAHDFEATIHAAGAEDLIFADPPYTVAHNFNGFVKYNETIFSWSDQERLAGALKQAASRGAKVIVTNADHPSVRDLYDGFADIQPLARASVIAGGVKGRQQTSELLIQAGGTT
jgi:DNA adenine methylase